MVSVYMGGTCGSGVLSSAGEMSVVRGVGRVCDMSMCLARGGVGGVGGERIGFDRYQSWRNKEKVGYVCVLFAVVWVMFVCCESGLFVLMAGPGICIVC